MGLINVICTAEYCYHQGSTCMKNQWNTDDVMGNINMCFTHLLICVCVCVYSMCVRAHAFWF